MGHGARPRRFEVQVGDRGRLVLPADLRESLGVKPGDRIVLTLEAPGEARLTTLRRQAEKLCGLFAGIQPERRLSEELISERRREAKREG